MCILCVFTNIVLFAFSSEQMSAVMPDWMAVHNIPDPTVNLGKAISACVGKGNYR